MADGRKQQSDRQYLKFKKEKEAKVETIVSKTGKIECLFKSCSVNDAQPQACGSCDFKFSDIGTIEC